MTYFPIHPFEKSQPILGVQSFISDQANVVHPRAFKSYPTVSENLLFGALQAEGLDCCRVLKRGPPQELKDELSGLDL